MAAQKETMAMSADAVGSSSRCTVWWKRAFRSFGAVSGLFAAVSAGTSVATAQDTAYRSASAAPVSWQEFAKLVQTRFQQRFAADDEGARKFRDYLTKRAADGSATPLKPSVRVWVLPDGKLERLEFDGLDDDDVAVTLRAILMRGDIGAPPQDMLQPLHLRLSLQ
jgi:hypothetical protein